MINGNLFKGTIVRFTRDYPAGKNFAAFPGIACGDRAVYLGESQIKMLSGVAKDWLFTILITADLEVV